MARLAKGLSVVESFFVWAKNIELFTTRELLSSECLLITYTIVFVGIP